MKKLATLLFIGILPIIVFSQNWRNEFYSASETKGSQSFYEIQKDFNNFWSKYDLKNGYYYENGVKHKAAGWKQFKRWEWFWETRIDRKSGNFPSVNTYSIQKEYLKASKGTADLANWQTMGPKTSEGGYAGIGRINCIAFHPTDVNTFFIGAPSGGLWKTTDGGTNWKVLTDTLPVIGVSEIFIPNDYETSKTIYIATGDRDGGDNYSIGVLKSTDDGKTWATTGLTFNVANRYRITRMLAHPTQQNIIYAATNGGIYKTSNSGTNWTKVQSGLFFDMEFKHNCEDSVLFAVTAASSNLAPKLYKTKDAGTTWNVVHSFPSSTYRIELDVAESDSTIVYALACTNDGGMNGLYKSSNSGESFSKIYDGTISGNNLLNWSAGSADIDGQGWYDLTLSVSPTDANTIYLGGINSWKSTNGGLNWNMVNHWYGNGAPEIHADKHYMEFQNGTTFFEANDGGIYKTTDGGTTWTDLTNNMTISQMYKLGVSQTVKDEVISGLQDNGSKLISANNWSDVKGGDGMECLIDYTDVNVQYATYVNGQIDRTLNHWISRKDITASIPGGATGAWVTPYVMDPKNNQTLYVGYSDVWKTTDRGNTWAKISSVNLANKIRSMAIAPSNNKTLYITDFDNFFRTTDGGTNWVDLTSNLPVTNNSITYISVDAIDPNIVWITFGGYDNIKAFESTNGGNTWTDISSGLPAVPANTIIQNKLSKTQQLYAGTDIGVFVKDGSAPWTLFSKNLPSVIVSELEIHYDNTTPNNSVLYAATYGRGLWKSNLSTFATPEIRVNAIEGSYYVSNDSTAKFTVSFTSNITFSSNTFTAYLSDKNGSFSNPTLIGTKTTDTDKTINVAIPKGTQSGENYRIKVVSSSPAYESTLSNPIKVILDTEAPTITVSSTQGTSTSLLNFFVTVTFSEPVIGFEKSDITATNATINTFSGANAPQYLISVSPIASGNVTIDIPANKAHDFVGNWNAAATQWVINYTPTSVDELVEYGISLYPNPTKGIISLNFGKTYNDVEVSIQDLLGRSVYENKIKGEGIQPIDLSNLSKSAYIVTLKIGDKKMASKIIVE